MVLVKSKNKTRNKPELTDTPVHCIDPTETDQPGHYTRHAHPTDCRKFYVCIEGVARPYGCSLGTVFNVDTLQCDDPENVPGWWVSITCCSCVFESLHGRSSSKMVKANFGHTHQSESVSRSLTGSQTFVKVIKSDLAVNKNFTFQLDSRHSIAAMRNKTTKK